APLVHTLHVTPYECEASLRALFPDAVVTAISDYQWSAFPGLPATTTIYHGVDAGAFAFRREPEDYVCYLGRFTPGKGPLQAIEAARALGVRLLLAGPADDYYEREV